MDMTPDRWAHTCEYLQSVFGAEDEHLATLMERAVEAGLPDIAVDSSVGRMLQILTRFTGQGRGATLAVELGTLAGYSGIWIARGLAPGGKLVTVEPEGQHADFAQKAFDNAGVGDRVEILRTTGLEALDAITQEHGLASVDLVFLDAIKSEYPAYFDFAAPLVRPGGLLLADNTLGGGSWWIDEAEEGEARESRDAVDRFNRMIASDERFEACAVPIREGVVIARRREARGW